MSSLWSRFAQITKEVVNDLKEGELIHGGDVLSTHAIEWILVRHAGRKTVGGLS